MGFASHLKRTCLPSPVVLLTLSMIVLGHTGETVGSINQSQRHVFDTTTGLFYDGVRFSYLKAVVYYQPNANHDNFLENIDLDAVDMDFGRVVEAGFNAIKLEIPWGSVLTSSAVPYVWNEANLAKLDTLVQAAQNRNLYVIMFLSGIKVPQGVNGYPKAAMAITTRVEDWNAWKEYSKKLMERYRDKRNVVALNTGLPTLGIRLDFHPLNNEYHLAAWTNYLTGINPNLNYWAAQWNDVVETDPNGRILLPRYWYYPNGTAYPKASLSSIAKWRTYFEWLGSLVNQRVTELYNDATAVNPNAMFLVNMVTDVQIYTKGGVWQEFDTNNSYPRALTHAYYSIGRYPRSQDTDPDNSPTIAKLSQQFDRAVTLSGKPCFLTEVGCSTYSYTTDYQARWYRNQLNLLTQKKIAGYAAWCWIDHTNHPSPEQSAYGLRYANGSPKPALNLVSQMNRQELGVTISATTVTSTATTTSAATPTLTTTSTTTGAITASCVIASAAYGSEMAPQIQFLREFRDHTVVPTFAGAQFINAFNAFYYSFSPILAQAALANPAVAALIRLLIAPMIAALRFGSSVFHALPLNPELAVLTAGLAASGLIGAIYATPTLSIFWMIGMRSKKRVFNNPGCSG